MRISDWSSDVCSSDLGAGPRHTGLLAFAKIDALTDTDIGVEQVGALHRDRQADDRPPAVAHQHDLGLVVAFLEQLDQRSEERRVGKECGRTFIYRWAPYNSKKDTNHHSKIDIH